MSVSPLHLVSTDYLLVAIFVFIETPQLPIFRVGLLLCEDTETNTTPWSRFVYQVGGTDVQTLPSPFVYHRSRGPRLYVTDPVVPVCVPSRWYRRTN